MKYEIQIDRACPEPKVVIYTAGVTGEVRGLIRYLSEEPLGVITGFREDRAYILEPGEIVRIFAGGGKVTAVTGKGEYGLRLRLYQVEERLDKDTFVRISNSEIVNLKKALSFDLSFSGTISIRLWDGTTSYVSRRYVPKIKKILGI